MPGTTVFAFAASGDCRKPTRSSVLLRSGERRCEVRSWRVELDASMEACDKSGCLRTMLAYDFRQNKVNFVCQSVGYKTRYLFCGHPCTGWTSVRLCFHRYSKSSEFLATMGPSGPCLHQQRPGRPLPTFKLRVCPERSISL
jgi:hypothetical protein